MSRRNALCSLHRPSRGAPALFERPRWGLVLKEILHHGQKNASRFSSAALMREYHAEVVGNMASFFAISGVLSWVPKGPMIRLRKNRIAANQRLVAGRAIAHLSVISPAEGRAEVLNTMAKPESIRLTFSH
jgi:hypothetical protein